MKIAVGILVDSAQRVLITQRPLNKPYGGFWEFPGGKVELGESVEQALVREIFEEVGLEIIHYRRLGEIQAGTFEKAIILNVFLITAFNGNAVCCENQLDLRWVELSSLTHFTLPPANEQIIQLIYSEGLGSVDMMNQIPNQKA